MRPTFPEYLERPLIDIAKQYLYLLDDAAYMLYGENPTDEQILELYDMTNLLWKRVLAEMI